jgi:4-hydroxybenzoate polyprenyltransferase
VKGSSFIQHRTGAGSMLRALLVLGRVSNLPTVWSNCLAAWFLSGAGSPASLLWLATGASFLYAGGMYLNDACDVGFDAQHRRERPIPAGRVSVQTVWLLGGCWLALGLVFSTVLGGASVGVALVLTVTIVIYDVVHKLVRISPWIMGLCRLLLYLLAGSAAEDGITGTVVWSSLALFAYVVGVGVIAQRESLKGPFPLGSMALLLVPILLGLLVNTGEQAMMGLTLSLVLGLWIFASLSLVIGSATPNVGLSVSRLLAGIALVDLLAVGGQSYELAFLMAACFAAAVGLQRFVPAT